MKSPERREYAVTDIKSLQINVLQENFNSPLKKAIIDI